MIKKILILLTILNFFILSGFSALTDNNVAYYTFDDVDSFTFHSNTQNGATGILGGAFNFDGSTDYLSTPFNWGTLDTDLSFNMWIYDDGKTDVMYFTNILNGHIPYFQVQKSTPTEMKIYAKDSNGIVLEVFATIPINEWFMVTGIRNSITQQLEIYINNVLIDSIADTRTGHFNTGRDFLIGEYPYLSTFKFQGNLDDLAFYNRVLTAQEITDLYNAGIGGTAENVANDYVYYLPFDSLSDSTLNENHLQEYASPTLTTGLINTAYSFDGVNDHLKTNNIIFDTSNEPFSIGLWVNMDVVKTSHGFFTQYNGLFSTSEGIWWAYNNNNQHVVRLFDGVGGFLNIDFFEVININEWYYLTVTFDGTTLKSFINGIEKSSGVGTYIASNDPLFFGTYEQDLLTTNILDGNLDEIGIWKRDLSLIEIQELYNGGLGFQFVTNPLLIEINTPIEFFNYTYDVENIELNIDTSINANCDYTYNAITTPFTTTGLLNHVSQFNLGAPINESLNFEILISCIDETLTFTTEKTIIFHRQQEPLDFEILVPQDQQHFNYDTSVIEFYIQTNYVANCTYQVYNMTTPQQFSSTTSSVHKTNYTAFYPNVNEYLTTFTCEGINVIETTQKNVTFIIDEQISSGIGNLGVFMEDVGTGTGGLLNAITSPVIYFLLIFVVSVSIGAIIISISTRIKEVFKR